MYVQRETGSGLNLPSAEDLACSQRGAIRSGGPRAPGRRFKSRPVCFIVRRLKPVCWKVFLLFHMIDLPPPPQPFTPIALSYTSYESQTPCRSLFSLHTFCVHISVSHLLSSAPLEVCDFLKLFSLYFIPFFLSIYVFFVFLSVSVSESSAFCAWYCSVFLCLLPVTVLQGHCWYNHSFWLSSRLTRGWPGPSAASLPAAATASINEGHLVFPTAGWHLDLLFQSSHTCGCIPVH